MAAERRRPARSDGAHDPDFSAAEMPGMDLAIDITVAAEYLRHFQDWCHDAQAGARFSSLSRSNGLCVLPMVVLATCA